MNRLAYEKSPYLLQHAHNPVDWYPWGREAFEKAAREDKPVFLSIGYSTCHWCHVMERESFENPETAAILNANFVSVKVDREERPDIDQVYMGYVTASTGSGGWPMSVFLTPEQKPFYGGTYFPPKEAYGIPSFPRLLQALALSWKNQRNEIILSSESAIQYLNAQGTEGTEPGETWDGERLKAEALQRFEQQYDDEYAGFGRAPKFPRAHALQFLIRTAHSSASTTSKKMAQETLNAMADGGIYDVLEGGFHRYSTDARWRIPHFEKMLYDQAMLARAYAEAFRMSPNPAYEQVIRQTLKYVENRLTDSSGAFYSAEDADSEDPQEPGRKKEGAFFLWRKTELEEILGPQDAQVACRYFGVEQEGNALSDPHGEFKGLNVLYKACSMDDLSRFFEKRPEDLRQTLDRIREKLSRERECRPRPHRDEKILMDWNALMIAAFAEASMTLDEPRYADAALRAAKALQKLLRDSGGRWHHSYCKGHQGAPANLSDVAFLADAFLSLYEATWQAEWLEEACRLADGLTDDFEDKEKGGFFFTSARAERLIYRPKEFYDGALPSGNSAAACMLARLSCFSQNEKYGKIASRVLDAFAPALRMDPSSAPVLLMAWDWLGPFARLVRIVSGSGGDEALRWKRAASRSPYPWQVVVAVCEDGEGVYAQICENLTCGLPIRNFEEFQKWLGLLKS